MESTDLKLETPLSEEIQENAMGQSLLALIQTHAGPSPAASMRSDVIERPDRRLASQANSLPNSLRMAEMYLAIGQLLELMYERIVDNPPPAGSAEEFHQMIQASAERQCNTIEAALKQWESERKSQEAERMIHMESLQVQAQIEVNRLLRVMWLGTGLAAAGAGIALFLMRT